MGSTPTRISLTISKVHGTETLDVCCSARSRKVCVHVYVCVCVYTCVCVICLGACVYLCMYACMRVCVCARAVWSQRSPCKSAIDQES